VRLGMFEQMIVNTPADIYDPEVAESILPDTNLVNRVQNALISENLLTRVPERAITGRAYTLSEPYVCLVHLLLPLSPPS
jgi:hypothetical protein